MWKTEKCNLTEVLSRAKIVRKNTQQALKTCLYNDGYIAGGFARSFASAFLTDVGVMRHHRPHRPTRRPPAVRYDEPFTWDFVVSYLGDVNSRQFDKYAHSNKSTDRLWKAGCGDIDVFFPTENAAQLSIHELLRSNETQWNAPTIAGFGHEFVVGDCILQLLTRVTGAPSEVVNSFDISNAKVYIDSTGVHYTDKWLELEQNRLLGIDAWDKPNLLWRVKKWFNKHSYLDFAPGNQEKYVDVILNAAKQASSGELKRWGDTVRIGAIQAHGKLFTDVFAPKELLRLSLIYDTYDQLRILRQIAEQGNK